MKTLIHTFRCTDICIYSFENNIIKGLFFKEKPSVGDVIMTHTSRDSNFLNMFCVAEILENRDSKVQKECDYDKSNAYFELKVENVTGDSRFEDVDNRIAFVLK